MGFLSTDAAAAKLGVSRSRVIAMIRAGVLKATKFGRDWAIEEASLKEPRVVNRRPGRPKKRKP